MKVRARDFDKNKDIFLTYDKLKQLEKHSPELLPKRIWMRGKTYVWLQPNWVETLRDNKLEVRIINDENRKL